MVNLYTYGDHQPRIDPTAFVAPGARIAGDVVVGPNASVWFNAIIRGDSDAVRVGAGSNVQDLAILHTDSGSPCVVSEECTIGHSAIVHGCMVGRGSLIGMGAIVLSGAVIGEESLVAAGTLVPEGREFGPRSLLIGAPARRVREITDEEVDHLIRPGVENYQRYARDYRDSLRDEGPRAP
jgi:carbonic anhydrase/acetyltransferase-like protein (isoleucine patch superfamily)